jgi:hypothetical protein
MGKKKVLNITGSIVGIWREKCLSYFKIRCLKRSMSLEFSKEVSQVLYRRFLRMMEGILRISLRNRLNL